METRGTILVVDDDPDIAGVMRELLAVEGYRVLVAPSIGLARDILAAFRVGLVITDGFHSGMYADRWTPLQPLVDAAAGRPLVLCSAHDLARYADFAAHGIAAYLPKPFDFADLLALVGSFLRAEGHPAPELILRHPVMPREG